jgi:esterase/lipase
MSRPIPLEEQLVRETLDAYRAEYKERSEDFKNLDVKAQGTITVCGIFLAGVIALLKDLSSKVTQDQRLLIICIAVMLSSSVICCMTALLVRRIIAVPQASDQDKLVDLFLKIQTPSDTQVANHIRDQYSLWADANTELLRANESKAGRLTVGQVMLVLAILASAVLIISLMIPR